MDRTPGNDVVIQEFPVYLSKGLSNQLCLVQYPQRPSTVSTANMQILETRIKPEQNKLQMTVGMDMESEFYDSESAEMFAEAAEGIGLDEDQYMPDHRLKVDKTTLESTSVPKLTEMSRYVVGVIQGGQISLTSLKSVVQMKTVFPYLNKAEKARTAYQKEQGGGDNTEDEEEEATKVTVKFSRNTNAMQNDKASARVSSYAARMQEEEEEYVDLDYVHKDSDVFDKLYGTDGDMPFYVVPKKEYLHSLFPKHYDTCIDGADSKGPKSRHNPKISIQQMKNMSIPEQLRVLLLNANVLQYHQVADFLKTKLKSEFDDVSLVRYVQTVAILVQGCWVVKSDVIYPEDFKSSTNGIAGTIMQRGRDFILSEFTEQRFLERKKLITQTKLPSEEVTEILSQVSVRVPKKGWEFLLPYDSNFISRFPDVVERQGLIWQMKKQHSIRHSSSSNPVEPSSSPPSRRKSRNRSISSSGDESGSGPDSDREHGSRRRRDSEGGSGRKQRRQRHNSNSSRPQEVGIVTKIES